MTTLDSAGDHLVLISTFTVDPDRADELLEQGFDPIVCELREVHDEPIS